MCARSSDNAFQTIVKRVKAARSLLAITHVHPDGDALGSMIALTQAGRNAGKTAWTIVPSELPHR